ncbi:amino acid adenylation domain-containing protein [uncultured Bradyrhizobium sp.]|uniref:non-ribosomal peptide synthetase n=1 Tax=uncultured Bradyrhizobium sp. TaxID=199684 RepID=UPI0035CBB7F8
MLVLQEAVMENGASHKFHGGNSKPAVSQVWQQVLELDRAIDDLENFFEIGGDSVAAVLVMLSLEEETGRRVPVKVFFKNPRLSDFATAFDAYDADQDEDSDGEAIDIGADDRPANNETIPLSFQQRQLWFLDQLYGANSSYNIPIVYRIDGAVDDERVRLAIDGLVFRHEVLRTVYAAENGAPYQVVQPHSPFILQTSDLSGHPIEEQDRIWPQIVADDVSAPFDLRHGPLFRARLIRISATRNILVLCTHHIAFDGMSANVLIQDLARLYDSSVHCDLRPVAQYADYAVAINREMQGATKQKLLDYWLAVLRDIPSRNDVPTDRPRRQEQRGPAEAVVRSFAGGRFAWLQTLARSHDTTLFVVLYAALSLLLSRYTRQRDVIIGTPMVNRGRPELLNMIGFFVNSLVLRNHADGSLKVKDFIAATAKCVQGAFERQQLPFDLLVEALRPDRSFGQNPLFDVMFIMQPGSRGGKTLGDAKLTELSVGNPAAKFDLTLNSVLGDASLRLEWEFDTNLYNRSTVEIIADQFEQVLEGFGRSMEIALDDICVMSKREAASIAEWNDTAKALRYPSIVGAFDAVAARRGGAIAIHCDGEDITYAQLRERSIALGQRLVDAGVRRNEPVGIFMPRGPDVIVAMLAILRGGAVYLPIDPVYPMSRVALIIDDAGLRFVMTGLNADANEFPSSVECIKVGAGTVPATVVSVPTGPRDPCYLMYTSGSTGKPKGVFVPQEGILRLVLDPGFVELGQHTVMLHATSIGFDLSAFEIWGALLNGGRLIIHAGVFDTAVLSKTMREHRVNTAWMSAGALEVFAGSLDGAFPDLRWLVAGGDVVPPKAVATMYRDNPNLRVVNGYGPTEASVLTTCYDIPRDFDVTRSVPIGRPIVNSVVEVWDIAGRPAGINIPGELVCAGPPVGLGYHLRPELNAERFPPDPDRPGLLRYRTGDLVCWREGGVIEFYGRLDNQLKIRGYRIEPAEIENALQRHPAVALGAVTVHGDAASTKFLVGWVKRKDGAVLDLKEVERRLHTELPEQCRPAFLREMPEVPVTVNGKIDRAALAKLFSFERQAATEKQSQTQQRMNAIWSDLLGISNQIGLNESFFELGGNSLLAVRLAARMNQEFDTALTVRAVFEKPRLGELGELVDRSLTTSSDPSSGRLTRLSHGIRSWLAFPGIGATSAAFLSVANAMAEARAEGVVVFEPKGLASGEDPETDIGKIARAAAEAAVKLAGDGPALLMGHSYGGRIAFETARHLERMGRRVTLLLLDNLPGNDLVDISFTTMRDTDEAVAEWLLGMIETAPSRRSLEPLNALVETGLIAESQVRRFVSIARAQFRILRSYRPSGPLRKAETLLIYAQSSLIGAHSPEAISLDLRSWCPGARSAAIAADHYSMLRDGQKLVAAMSSLSAGRRWD